MDFIIVLLIYSFLAIKEPEIIWDIRHRRFVEGGDPADWSIKSIVFSGYISCAIAVIMILLAIFYPEFYNFFGL